VNEVNSASATSRLSVGVVRVLEDRYEDVM